MSFSRLCRDGLLAACLVVVGHQQLVAQAFPTPQVPAPLPVQAANSPWRTGVSYEVFVRAFADSDGDGIGDLRGLTAKLGYLDSLGIKNLWLMPIHPSPSYHKYDVLDYMAVAPEYGTLDDLRALTAAAHKRGMRVILDLVLNHTSDRHPWFVSASSDPKSPYRDWYVWRNNYDTTTRNADVDSTREWAPAEAVNDRYYALFWGRMPDLNFDNPAVRAEMVKVGQFWLREAAVDGFRLDAARHVYNRTPEGQAKGVQFWAEWERALRKLKPDLYTVGEVWVETDGIAPFLAAFDANFNFPIGYAILKSIRLGRDSAQIARLIQQQHALYANVNPGFTDATFLTNHDQARVSYFLPDSAQQKLAASILLTLPGSPWLYYGEELGMVGPKPDPKIREPFGWATQAPENTKWRPENVLNGATTVATLDRQQADPASVYNHYRRWIALRNARPELQSATIEPVALGNDKLLAFWRGSGKQRLLVVHNLSNQPQPLTLPKAIGGRFREISNGEAGALPKIIAAYSSALLQPK